MKRAVDWFSWIAPVALALWSHQAWQAIPKPEGWRGIPVHFGPDGTADRWSTAYFEPVLLMPLVILLVVALITFLPQISALPENARRSAPALRWIKLIIVALFGWMQLGIIGGGAKGQGDLGGHMLLFMGLFFIAIGFVLPGLKRQGFAGIRVPWTLMHDLVWDESHRRGGPILVGAGMALVLMDFTLPGYEEWGFGLLMAAALFIGLVLPFAIFKRLQREGKLPA